MWLSSCTQRTDFDMNSGVESLCCRYHIMTVNDGMHVEDIELDDNQFEGMMFLQL